MGSYPSDKVPQLTKHCFAIINSAPSNVRGGHKNLGARYIIVKYHWLITCRLWNEGLLISFFAHGK